MKTLSKLNVQFSISKQFSQTKSTSS